MEYFTIMKILKQIINLNKAAFDNAYTVMARFQEQTEKIANMSMEKTALIPEDGKKLADTWAKIYKNRCEYFKDRVDNNFKRAEAFFLHPESQNSPKPGSIF